jgi:hypothetical protein
VSPAFFYFNFCRIILNGYSGYNLKS